MKSELDYFREWVLDKNYSSSGSYRCSFTGCSSPPDLDCNQISYEYGVDLVFCSMHMSSVLSSFLYETQRGIEGVLRYPVNQPQDIHTRTCRTCRTKYTYYPMISGHTCGSCKTRTKKKKSTRKSPRDANKRGHVYIIRDDGCNVIYVGKSTNAYSRLISSRGSHKNTKVWWDEAKSVEVFTYVSDLEASKAEVYFIRSMCPKYNIVKYVTHKAEYVKCLHRYTAEL